MGRRRRRRNRQLRRNKGNKGTFSGEAKRLYAEIRILGAKVGLMGRKIGDAGEERILKACRNETMPPWWKAIRPKTKEEDAQQIDHVITTDVGTILLQTKTSLSKIKNNSPTRTGSGVPIVYVSLEDNDPEIREKVIKIVARERDKRMHKKPPAT